MTKIISALLVIKEIINGIKALWLSYKKLKQFNEYKRHKKAVEKINEGIEKGDAQSIGDNLHKL